MKKRRKNTDDPGPALPLRPAWQPGIFRRRDRGGRLYARLKTREGKIIIRSTGRATEKAAREMAVLMMRHIAKGGTP